MSILSRIILILKLIVFSIKLKLFGKKKITKTDGKISYSSTVAEINFEVRNIKEQLDYMAENYPNKVAFIFHMNDGLKLTYSDLKDRSYILARNLMSLGLKKGDRIALLLPNTYEIVISYFASALSGLIVVPFDVSYGLEQADHILKTTEPSAFVLYNCVEYQSLISDMFPELNSCTLNNFKSNRYPSLRIAIVVDDHENKISKKFPSAWTYSDLESKRIDKEIKEFPYVDPDDIFAILPTSGTTSKPKCTIRRYFEFFKQIQVDIELNGTYPMGIIMCQTLLMYHIGATYMIIAQLFRTKDTIVFPSYDLNVKKALEAVEKYKCNMLLCLPKIYLNMLAENEQSKFDLSSVMFLGAGGQNMTAEMVKKLKKGFKNMLGIGNMLASTECNYIALSQLRLSELSGFNHCVGQPFPFVECKIVNPENGQIQPLNVDGELHVRSYGVTTGYWNDLENTRKCIDPSGWYNTGDILSMDKNGLLYFRGRSKEIITAKGWGKLDVHPSIIEECLLQHPNIIEAVAFGIPVNEYEQEICAWVKLRAKNIETTVEDVLKHCRENLSEYQVPGYVKIVDNFPTNVMGKYLRREMCSIYKKELSL